MHNGNFVSDFHALTFSPEIPPGGQEMTRGWPARKIPSSDEHLTNLVRWSSDLSVMKNKY